MKAGVVDIVVLETPLLPIVGYVLQLGHRSLVLVHVGHLGETKEAPPTIHPPPHPNLNSHGLFSPFVVHKILYYSKSKLTNLVIAPETLVTV